MTDQQACTQSARVLLDDRADELSRRRARAHQQTCPLCAWTIDIADEGLDPSLVLQRLAERRPRARTWLRMVLGTVAMVHGVVSFPWVFGYNPLGWLLGSAPDGHLTRDGTLGVLVAVAGVVTAWIPRYAYPMLCVCGAIVALQLGGGLVDSNDPHVGLHFEKVHLVALLIAALVAVVAFRRNREPA